MKKFIRYVALSVLSAQAFSTHAEPGTNRLQLLSPTNNLVLARGRVPQNAIGRAATNTPAFEEYGFGLMLTNANLVRERWQLDIAGPLTDRNVTFNLKATVTGIRGALNTKPNRFVWSFAHNTLEHFSDTNYWPRAFRHNDEASARLAKIQSKIDAQQAEAIARDCLHGIGLTEKQLQLREPPAVNQYKFEESNGKVYPLPMFNVSWDIEGREDKRFPYGMVTFDISGITRQVAEYSNIDPHTPRIPMATNYFEMLGVKPPENERQRQGLERLTPLAN